MSRRCKPTLPVLVFCLVPAIGLAATQGTHGPSEVIFLAQIIALIVCGRLMGELMQRIGQSAVMGQLIAGILLGPSVLGALWPGFQHFLFPASPEQKAMIDAVAQLGILLLLLLTGMAPAARAEQRSASRSPGSRYRSSAAFSSVSCCPTRCCRIPASG